MKAGFEGGRKLSGRSCSRIRTSLITLCAALLAGIAWVSYGGGGQGSITYTGKSGPVIMAVKNVYLVRGPDMAAGKVVRRLIFSTADLASKLKACQAMTCSDADLREGLAVDLDAGPRLNYWFVADNQKLQFSGTSPPTALRLTTDNPQRLTGQLAMDDSTRGGPKTELQFDVAMTKEFTRWR